MSSFFKWYGGMMSMLPSKHSGAELQPITSRRSNQMLQEEAGDLENDDFGLDLERINGAGKHLLGLINDVLDISKIEAGAMDIYLGTFPVAEMIQDVQATIQPLVEKNSNSLEIECPDSVGSIRSDVTKVKQGLFNLLRNASKFTEQGTISLKISRVNLIYLAEISKNRGRK